MSSGTARLRDLLAQWLADNQHPKAIPPADLRALADQAGIKSLDYARLVAHGTGLRVPGFAAAMRAERAPK